MLHFPRWLLLFAFVIFGIVASLLLIPLENAAVLEQLAGFPDSHILSHRIRPFILAVICFMPAIASISYTLGNTFDRYLSRQFLSIFMICLGSLLAIWMLLDLNDNLSDFSKSPNIALTLAKFYFYRSPAILLVLLPYSLLLANIYCFGKLSKSNEIIAMTQAGTGIARVSAPIIFAGLWCSILLLGLNYHWAPHAEGKRNEMLALAQGRPITQAEGVLYRDPNSNRLWFVGTFPQNYRKGEPLQNVEITTINPDRTLRTRISSPSASYNRETRIWTLENPVIGRFKEGQSPIYETMNEPMILKTWEETPAQIIKPGLSVEYLGIPEITTWLKSPLSKQTASNPSILTSYLTHWHYRWALPITCIVTVLLAAPLSIHFARRGAGSGIFLAVALSILMIFFSTITLALGESGTLKPIIAAWLPNICFAILGLYLYQRRINGRPIYHSLKQIFSLNN